MNCRLGAEDVVRDASLPFEEAGTRYVHRQRTGIPARLRDYLSSSFKHTQHHACMMRYFIFL